MGSGKVPSPKYFHAILTQRQDLATSLQTAWLTEQVFIEHLDYRTGRAPCQPMGDVQEGVSHVTRLRELVMPVDGSAHENTEHKCRTVCTVSTPARAACLLPSFLLSTNIYQRPCARHWVHTGEQNRQGSGPHRDRNEQTKQISYIHYRLPKLHSRN